MTPEALEQIRQAEAEMEAESAFITVTDHYIQQADGTIWRVRTHGKDILEYEPNVPVVVAANPEFFGHNLTAKIRSGE